MTESHSHLCLASFCRFARILVFMYASTEQRKVERAASARRSRRLVLSETRGFGQRSLRDRSELPHALGLVRDLPRAEKYRLAFSTRRRPKGTHQCTNGVLLFVFMHQSFLLLCASLLCCDDASFISLFPFTTLAGVRSGGSDAREVSDR